MSQDDKGTLRCVAFYALDANPQGRGCSCNGPRGNGSGAGSA